MEAKFLGVAARAEILEDLEVEVHRAVANVAAAKIRDKRLAQLVKQRATEKNRDTR